ncbi:heptaprenyl diphosphate synthase component 1 [Lentibacillus salicampi]|uniref:heptaprenyl diphosphate synthase component 1 n=1 Tax=Lentibacillus salicampi TaxID=175306 RepID=UPI0014309552|nr:heptaprenyl diphosphate synthase component 1 [Lentibacillus salicampi]
MQTPSVEVNKLKALINEKMHHSYIEQYVQTPHLNEDKLYMLALILNNTGLPEYKKNQYIVTAMLVQMALDTHDLVSNTDRDVLTDNDEKSKQLAVLAGDYYSGLYYFLLSEIEEVKMIQVLATAITDINEYKMQLYYKDIHSLETFFHVFKKIETLLITRIAAFAGETDISEVAAEWLLAKRLLNTKNISGYSRLDRSLGHWSEQIPVSCREEALHAIDKFIHEETSLVEKGLAHFPAYLSSIKTCMLDTLRASASNKSSMAEEG